MVSLKVISQEKESWYININLYSSLKLFKGIVCEIGLSIWWHLANMRENVKCPEAIEIITGGCVNDMSNYVCKYILIDNFE